LIQINAVHVIRNPFLGTNSGRRSAMRSLILAGVALALTPIAALAASDCRVTGSPSAFGVNMTAYFGIGSGQTCRFPMRIPGMMKSSGISQKPAHGTLRQLNVTTFTYTANASYKGADTFAIYGTGEGPYGSGTSIMTVNATIQ
jgi:hypothetical protein